MSYQGVKNWAALSFFSQCSLIFRPKHLTDRSQYYAFCWCGIKPFAMKGHVPHDVSDSASVTQEHVIWSDVKLNNTRWGRVLRVIRQCKCFSSFWTLLRPLMMCYDLVELFLSCIFSGRKPKWFTVTQSLCSGSRFKPVSTGSMQFQKNCQIAFISWPAEI